MKVLILGGHGFIGHHTTRQLKDLGHTVSIIDCHHQYGEFPDWEYAPVMSQKLTYIGSHDYHIADVTDAEMMDILFNTIRPDVVIDLATYPNAKMVKKNVVDATENMITATAIALNLCVKYKVQRFVIASSSMVYGEFEGSAPTETAVCNPLTLYGSYKLQCERMCKIWYKEHGLEYTILRPSALYGTRDMVVRAISKMTVSALTTGKIEVNGATNRLDFSWVEDVASAFVVAATDSKAANEIFNCTRGYGRTILEAAELVQTRIPAEIVQLPHDRFYPNRDTLNSNKLKTLTSWNPTMDIEQGINLYLDWFLAQDYITKF
jgi:nucleoside-diphosphate-sugar epimerase